MLSGHYFRRPHSTIAVRIEGRLHLRDGNIIGRLNGHRKRAVRTYLQIGGRRSDRHNWLHKIDRSILVYVVLNILFGSLLCLFANRTESHAKAIAGMEEHLRKLMIQVCKIVKHRVAGPRIPLYLTRGIAYQLVRVAHQTEIVRIKCLLVNSAVSQP